MVDFKILLLVLLLFVSGVSSGQLFRSINAHKTYYKPINAIQADYYISSYATDDSGDGLTPQTAKKTLNSVTPSAGETVALNGVFEGQSLIVPSSGTSGNEITYTSWYPDSVVEIYSSDKVTGWTNYSGNIWRASISGNVSQVFSDGIRLQSARLPKTGYYSITSVTNDSTFTSTDLSSEAENHYQGFEAGVRNSLFSFHIIPIASSTGNTLELEFDFFGSAAEVGEGFFITGDLSLLTQPGEYYYDDTNDFLYVWLPENEDPSNHTIRASIRDYGIDISDVNYVVINGINIMHSSLSGIYTNNADFITISECNIYYPNLTGIENSGSGVSITSSYNYIIGANGRGIDDRNDNSVISYNTIHNIGQFDQLNDTTFNDETNLGTAILSRGDNQEITYNEIITAGYCGINFQGLNTHIQYNYIENSCNFLDDGGGIYTYSGGLGSYPYNTRAVGSIIEDNVIIDTYGNIEGTPKWFSISAAIYLDEGTKGVVVRDNYASGATTGLFVKGGQNLIRFNTVFDAMLAFRAIDEAENCNIFNNTFYQSKRADIYTWWSEPDFGRFVREDNASYTYDSNYYYSRYGTTGSFYTAAEGYDSFAEWQTYGMDTHGTFNTTPLEAFEREQSIYTAASDLFYLNDATGVKNLSGSALNNDTTLSAYTGAIVTAINAQAIRDSVYTTSELLENVIAWFDLNEPADSTILIDSTLWHNGTIGTAVTANGSVHTYTAAVSNWYDYFPDNDELTLGNSFTLNFKFNSASMATTQRIIAKANEWYAEISTSGYIRVRMYDTSGTSVYHGFQTPTSTITTGVDYKVIIDVQDAVNKTWSMTINGVTQTLSDNSVGTLTTIANTSNSVNIGGQAGSGSKFNGTIDRVLIFKDTLSGSAKTNLDNLVSYTSIQ